MMKIESSVGQERNYPIKSLLLVFLLGAFFFIPYLGAVHLFDWDEINFAESAREMLLTDDYFRVQINFKPFWEKPPLFIWLQAISMQFFGVNEFAARLPNALVGIATLMIVFTIGKKHYNVAFGWWWVLAYLGSFLPHLYFKSGIIDPLFNLFIFLGIYFLARVSGEVYNSKSQLRYVILSGSFIGLAVLTKGPVALLIAVLCISIYCILNRSVHMLKFKLILFFAIPVAIIAFAWFGVETLKNGPWFLKEFIVYQIRLFRTQDAGHGGPFFYHFIVLYAGCFPASIFIFSAFKKDPSDLPEQKFLKLWLTISFFVVLLLFSIVKTKIIHYSSFCYFPLTFLAAYSISKIVKEKSTVPAWLSFQIGSLGGIISILLIAFPLLLKSSDEWLPSFGYLIKDRFALANLKSAVNWSGYESLIGGIYLLSIICLLIFDMKVQTRIILLFTSTAIVLGLTLLTIVPKIEQYSQGTLIEFFKSLEDKNVYADVYGFKSYAHLFYTKKKPDDDSLSIHQEHLLHGPVRKDVYLVSKITNTNLDQEPLFTKIGERSGYNFYYRKHAENQNEIK